MRLLLATLTLAAAAALPAAADEPSTYTGQCGYDTVRQDAVTGGQWTGTAYGYFAVYSPAHGNAVTATVTCQVEVDGVVQPEATVSGSGTGLVVLGGPVTFTASDTAEVELCWTVDYTSDATPTARRCAQSTNSGPFPPQEWIDLIDYVLWLLSPALDGAEAVLCGATGGDLYVADVFVWDCPPYEHPPNPEPAFPSILPLLPFWDPPFGVHGPTGGGYNTGDAGLLVLTTREAPGVTAACAFATAGDTIAVAGAVTAPGASATSVRCRLLDAYDGTVLYDGTAATALRDTIAATGRPVTVCATGAGDDAVVGERCRPGAPV